MNNARPIMHQCTAPSCRKRLTIPVAKLYYVTMPNRHGGTHHDAGYDCPSCKHENVIPASMLPKGVLGQLPARSTLVQRDAAPFQTPVVWKMQTEARKELVDALHLCVGDPTAKAILLIRHDGVLVPRDGAEVLRLRPEDVLLRLDQIGAEMLILEGTNGHHPRWRLVLDHKAGAAATRPAA